MSSKRKNILSTIDMHCADVHEIICKILPSHLTNNIVFSGGMITDLYQRLYEGTKVGNLYLLYSDIDCFLPANLPMSPFKKNVFEGYLRESGIWLSKKNEYANKEFEVFETKIHISRFNCTKKIQFIFCTSMSDNFIYETVNSFPLDITRSYWTADRKLKTSYNILEGIENKRAKLMDTTMEHSKHVSKYRTEKRYSIYK